MIANFAALAFVLACALAYVFAGGSFDVGRLVAAVPVAAVAFVALAVFIRLFAGSPRPAAPRLATRGRGNPFAALAFAVIGMLVAGVMTTRADNDRRAYFADPSCRAGFAAVGFGACRLVSGRIVRAYHTGRSSTPTVDLEFPDGSRHRVVISRDVSGHLWRAARDGSALEATAQLQGPSVVQVVTQGGLIQTADYPQNRLRAWSIIGILAGVFGLLSAAGLLLRGFL